VAKRLQFSSFQTYEERENSFDRGEGIKCKFSLSCAVPSIPEAIEHNFMPLSLLCVAVPEPFIKGESILRFSLAPVTLAIRSGGGKSEKCNLKNM
jgi:hypothetical protein